MLIFFGKQTSYGIFESINYGFLCILNKFFR